GGAGGAAGVDGGEDVVVVGLGGGGGAVAHLDDRVAALAPGVQLDRVALAGEPDRVLDQAVHRGLQRFLVDGDGAGDAGGQPTPVGNARPALDRASDERVEIHRVRRLRLLQLHQRA